MLSISLKLECVLDVAEFMNYCLSQREEEVLESSLAPVCISNNQAYLNKVSQHVSLPHE